jgi:WD40 repeat protein
MVGSADGRWLAIGTTGGRVFVYSATNWKEYLRHPLPEAVRDLAFSADGEELAIAAGSQIYRLHMARPPEPSAHIGSTHGEWSKMSLLARNIAFSPDGKWFAATCADGTIWFYAIAQNAWISHPVSSTDVFFGTFSENGVQFVATDAERVLLIDMSRLMAEYISTGGYSSEHIEPRGNEDLAARGGGSR